MCANNLFHLDTELLAKHGNVAVTLRVQPHDPVHPVESQQIAQYEA